MKCSTCGRDLGAEILQCKQCLYKYHCQCVNISIDEYHNLSMKHRANWLCTSCINVTRRTQAPATQDESMNVSFELHTPPNKLDIRSSNNMVTMENISNLLDQKLNQSLQQLMDNFRKIVYEEVIKHVHAEVSSIAASLREDFTRTTDYICADQQDLKKEIDAKTQNIKELEKSNELLQKEIISLNRRISTIEKISRNQNLELQAVPENRHENVLLLFKTLCKTVGFEINDCNILSCRRVAKINRDSNRPRNVLVSLTSSLLRDQIISACRRFRMSLKNEPLNCSHLGFTSNNTKIFISEHNSPECKAIHAAARMKAKELNYKFVWVKYDRVYMRKEDRADQIHIKNLEMLNKLS